MNILEIEQHRFNKIESLLCNRVDAEYENVLQDLNQSHFSSIQKKKVVSTLDFAVQQNYVPGEISTYYVTHPIRVARYTLQWLKIKNIQHVELVQAALIHNCLEKNLMTVKKIENKFGAWISSTIDVLTVEREKQYQGDWLEKYYERVLQLDKFGLMLKSLDKFDNLYALCLNPDDKVRYHYLAEIKKYITPLFQSYYPELLAYFQKLVEETEQLGHFSKDQFLAKIQQH